MNFWPPNDDQLYRLTVFSVVMIAIIVPVFLFTLRQDYMRKQQRMKQQEFERLRIKRKRR